MIIDAIQNGIVIDHITAGKSYSASASWIAPLQFLKTSPAGSWAARTL